MPPRSHYYSNYTDPHNPRADSPIHRYQSRHRYHPRSPISTHHSKSQSRASSLPKKHKRHNHPFTTSLHIFIALVVLDFIAETQLRTSARRLYQKYHATTKTSPNSSPNLKQSKWQPQQSDPSPAQSPPAIRRSKNPIIVSRPSTSYASSPASPTTLVSPTGQSSAQLSSPLRHHSPDMTTAKQLSLKSQLTTMLAWLPMETLEEILEVCMEMLAEGADAL